MGRGRRARWVGVVAGLLALVLGGCGDVVDLALPTATELALVPRDPAVQSVVYDAEGRQLAVLRREYREPVPLARIPGHVVQAVLTAEDHRFHQHRGVDARSIARAAIRNAAAGEVEQGGSTITQQLVKLLYQPEADRSPATKLQEAVLARELERERSKASILEDYLNTVYFGEGAHGIKAAAWSYFRAEVEDLDVAQGALLAAIIRAPEAFTPRKAPEAARIRRDDVLQRMAAAGHLTVEERDAALATPIAVEERPPTPATREPHFVDFVVRGLLADPRFGATEAERATRLYEGGLHIHTTLQPELQELARATLAAHLTDPDGPEAAIAVVDPATGAVLAAAGNRSYDELQYDLATQARRQPGSTFKTFVLASAIADGWHPEDRIDGRQGTITTPVGGWQVRNYDRHDYRSVTLSGATRASVNAAYARLGLELGLSRVAGTARAMGVRSRVPEDEPQITIGGGDLGVTVLDMAAAYGTLANLGTHVPTTPIDRIEDADGATVWLPDTAGRAALSPSAAYVTTEVLRDVVERGTALHARVPGWEVAGKTGTTSDNADAWFAGYTPTLSAAVWIGHAEGSIPLRDVEGVGEVTGGSLPARIFSAFLRDALAGQEPRPFTLPDDEWVLTDVDPDSGLLAAPWCPGELVRLPRVLVPTDTCPEPAPAPPPATAAPRAPAPPSATPAAPSDPDGAEVTPPAPPSPTPSPATSPPPSPPASPPPAPPAPPAPTDPAPDPPLTDPATDEGGSGEQ